MGDLKEIRAEEVRCRLEEGQKLNLIDVREDFEVVTGKIPSAIHIPMNAIPEQMQHFRKDQSYIIICAGGIRSEKVCRYLLANGIDAINMIDGMNNWSGEQD